MVAKRLSYKFTNPNHIKTYTARRLTLFDRLEPDMFAQFGNRIIIKGLDLTVKDAWTGWFHSALTSLIATGFAENTWTITFLFMKTRKNFIATFVSSVGAVFNTLWLGLCI